MTSCATRPAGPLPPRQLRRRPRRSRRPTPLAPLHSVETCISAARSTGRRRNGCASEPIDGWRTAQRASRAIGVRSDRPDSGCLASFPRWRISCRRGAGARRRSRTWSARSTSRARSRNAIRAGRVAHAFLFTGVRGVGKTTAARILAKALNCEQGPTPTPCNVCVNCQRSPPAARSTCSRSTAPRTPASTTCASSSRTCATRRPRAASRSTSSTRSTCSRTAPSTRC